MPGLKIKISMKSLDFLRIAILYTISQIYLYISMILLNVGHIM